MGDVVDFPQQVEEVTDEEKLNMLTYKWWHKDFFPMFKEGDKIERSYFVYGELFESIRILWHEEMIDIHDEDGNLGLAMEPAVADIIYQTMIGAYNLCRADGDDNDEEIIH